MARRFSRLKYSLKALQGPLGGTTNAAPAGSILENFNKVLTGQTKLEYPRDAASKQGAMLRKGVKPFGLSDITNPGVVEVSNRAFTNSNLSAIVTACAIVAGDASGITRYVGFRPARVIVFVKGAASDTLETSKITGVKYNPRDGASFTLPFGKSAGTDSYSERRELIVAAANVATMSLSFKPEDSPVL